MIDNKSFAPSCVMLVLNAIGAKMPIKGYRFDAGWDIYVLKDTWVWPFCVVDVPSGFDICVPEEYGIYVEIRGRSSTFFRRKLMVNPGIIDAGYTGPLSIAVFNPTFVPKKIKQGERLAQIITHYAPPTHLMIVSKAPETERGGRGFGSTGD